MTPKFLHYIYVLLPFTCQIVFRPLLHTLYLQTLLCGDNLKSESNFENTYKHFFYNLSSWLLNTNYGILLEYITSASLDDAFLMPSRGSH